jgi:hypothetical protein
MPAPVAAKKTTVLDHSKVKGSDVDINKLRDQVEAKYIDREQGEFLFDDSKKLDDMKPETGKKFGITPAAMKAAQHVRIGYENFDGTFGQTGALPDNAGGGYASHETFALREQHSPMVAVVMHYRNPNFGPVATLIDGTTGTQLERARMKPASDGTWQVHFHVANSAYGDG